MKGRIRKHHSNLWVTRCNQRGKPSPLLFFQKQNRFLVPFQKLLPHFVAFTFPSHGIHIFHHYRKRLCRAPFAFPQSCNGLFIKGITAKMKTANSLDGCNPSIPKKFSNVTECFRPPDIFSNHIYLRSAFIAADRLCIKSSRFCVGIFPFTGRTHRKLGHTGSFPVIRHGIKNRQSRPAAGTINKGMQVSPVIPVI